MAADAAAVGARLATAFTDERLNALARSTDPRLVLGPGGLSWDEWEEALRFKLLGLGLKNYLVIRPEYLPEEALDAFKGWVGLHVSPHLRPVVAAAANVVALLDKLRELTAPASHLHESTLREELVLLKQQANEPVAVYIVRAQTLANRLVALKTECPEAYLTSCVLRGLLPAFHAAREFLRMSGKTTSISDVSSLLVSTEKALVQQGAMPQPQVPASDAPVLAAPQEPAAGLAAAASLLLGPETAEDFMAFTAIRRQHARQLSMGGQHGRSGAGRALPRGGRFQGPAVAGRSGLGAGARLVRQGASGGSPVEGAPTARAGPRGGSGSRDGPMVPFSMVNEIVRRAVAEVAGSFGVCGECGGDHARRDCPTVLASTQCYKCGMMGHRQAACPQLGAAAAAHFASEPVEGVAPTEAPHSAPAYDAAGFAPSWADAEAGATAFSEEQVALYAGIHKAH